KLAGRLRAWRLTETIDPDRAEAELAGRANVVEEARRDVDIGQAAGLALERLPVAERRLVGADLRRDDRDLERDAELGHRRVDEVAVCVGEDRQLPAAAACLFERGRNLGKGPPGRERSRQGVLL